ncbi:MAG TPA: hypothetical protein VFM63_12810 [Pyrinomonadaceae bacterium]|nr:hypothetical protein [Pyrinomonadaceae bacterium]
MNNPFYRKRTFLASVSTGHTSYILTEVESSRGGEYKWGTCMVTIADCRRRIQLEFFLGTVRARRESLRKLDLLLKVLSSFRKVLVAEAQLITEYERAEARASVGKRSKKLAESGNTS